MRMTPPVDQLAAAVRLESLSADMRARVLAGGPERDVDDPPTGLLDLAAIRAAIGGAAEDVDPAAVAWLAGGPDPAAARVVEQVDQLEPRITYAPGVLEQVVERDLVDQLAPAVGPYVIGGQVPEAVCRCATLRPGDDCPAHPFDPSQCVTLEQTAPYQEDFLSEARPATAPRVFITEREPRPGWASRHDPRSLAYGVAARLGVAPLQAVDLPLGPTLDQGQEGECVGCGTVDATNVLRLLAGRRDLLKIDAAAALYHRAQQLDDVPGVDYSGTSVLAGMKAGVEAGYFGGYLWAFGTRDIATALGHQRPVVIGIPWLSGMYNTGPGGLVEVKGDDRGEGHCLVIARLRLAGPQGQPGPFFGWLNSWGRSYGDGGLGWIHHRDLAALLADRGEAAIPTPAAQGG